MIDLSRGPLVKLSPCDAGEIGPALAPLLVDGERVVATFKGLRDYVVFTDKRVVTVNVQGITGKLRDYTSLPYRKVQAFSVETAGSFDVHVQLDLWFQGLGKLSLLFKGEADIGPLARLIAGFVL